VSSHPHVNVLARQKTVKAEARFLRFAPIRPPEKAAWSGTWRKIRTFCKRSEMGEVANERKPFVPPHRNAIHDCERRRRERAAL
jgi:hypothetical protein